MTYVSIAVYAASFICYAWILYAPNAWVGRLASVLLASGIVSHYFALIERSHWIHAVPYDDLYGSMSLFAWLLAVTYLGLEFLHRQRSVGALVTSLLVVWIALVAKFAPDRIVEPPTARGPLFALHVTLNTWAYAAFALSFILSVVYLLQDRVLRSRHTSATFWRFPALDVLDRMARSSVYVGLVTMIVGVSLGFLYQRRLTGAISWTDPKVVVTLAIFLIYLAYLALSRTSRWRGARAARICALNFAVVLFSYTLVNLYLTGFHRFL
ncbi:MAG: cytochrome c biogenesis protein CcsA [Acidobacteriota bacterium]|nr:cytochrome c biogenesis protein CcsA [Acidobacteriota bacterium]MDE3169494.1 cytochrome c biogenesis protein CcsA [Acidobacteriota bacterium]